MFQVQKRPYPILCLAAMCMLAAQIALGQSSLIKSWQTQLSGRYARVVQTTGGSPTTTWPASGLKNMGGGQSIVAYSDIQQVSYSASWVYVKATGLASHQMGPWYDSTGAIFGNWPSNQKTIRRFPTSVTVPATKTTNGLGALGLWVNGVALFNLLDGFSYSTSVGNDVNGTTNTWVRNAVVTEGPTFDKSNAHQPGMGTYHYHSNPAALRYQLGDNISLNSDGSYSENLTQLHHSPILGWANDGVPIYGPYGYSNPSDTTSSIIRIRSGFTIRNGSNGTTALGTTGRHSLGKWAATLHNTTQTLSTSQYGPNVSTSFPLGRYIEDFDYLGDLGFTQGSDFDLDIYNGRFAKTPEFPNGIYAYYVTIASDGSPAFPYVLGRQYYGSPTGGMVTSITESVTVYSTGGAGLPIVADVAASAKGKSIKWLSVEGGTYKVEGSNDGSNWTTVATAVTSQGLTTSATFFYPSASANYTTYRATLTSTASYDGF